MNKIFRLVSRRGTLVACSEATKSHTSSARRWGGGIATALIASLAAVSVGVNAKVSFTGEATSGNWGTVTFSEATDTVDVGHTDAIQIATLRDAAGGLNVKEKLTINAQGNDFTIGTISVSMHHLGAELVMNNVGDVSVKSWNPANTTSSFDAQDANSVFKSEQTNFYQYGSYNVGKVSSTVSFSDFGTVDFGRLIVNQGATINLTNVGNTTFSSFQKANGEKLVFNLTNSGLTLQADGTNVDRIVIAEKNTLAVKTDAVIGTLSDTEKGNKAELNITVDPGRSLTINQHQYANGNTGGAEVTITGAKNVFNNPSAVGLSVNNFANAKLTVSAKGNGSTTAGELFQLGNTNFNASHSQVWVNDYKQVELGDISFQSKQADANTDLNKTHSGIFLTNVGEVRLGKVTTADASKSVIAFKGGTNSVVMTDDVTITSLYGYEATTTWNLNGHNLTITGMSAGANEGYASNGDLSQWDRAGVNMNMSKLHAVGNGTETVDIGSLRMGNKGLAFESLDTVRIKLFSVSDSTESTPRIIFDDVRFVDLTFGNDGSKHKYALDLQLGQSALGVGGEAHIDMTKLKAEGESAGKHNFSFNVSSSLAAAHHAEEFAQIRFVNDDWNKSTVSLGKGGWLRLGETTGTSGTFHAEAAVNEALRAFEEQGKTYSAVVTLAGASDWTGFEQTLKAADGSLLFVTDAAAANSQTALLTGTSGAWADDMGLYLSVDPTMLSEFTSGTVLKIADGDWTQFDGMKVGVNSLFTEWSAVGTANGLEYKFEKFKPVTEVLPEVIPEKGLEEIYGKPDEDGDGWDEGKGIIFVDKATGEIGTGGILAQTLVTLGGSDAQRTSDLLNAYSAMAVVAGAQSGAASIAQMSADALARHYSFMTTTGVQPSQTHKPGADLWVDVLYRHDQTRGLSNGSGDYGTRTNLSGFALGLDHTLNDNLTVGGIFNYVKGRTDSSDRTVISADNDTESFGLTAWAGWNVNDRCNLVASLGYAKGSNDITGPMAGDMASAFTQVYKDYANARPEGLPETIGTDVTAETDTQTISLGLRAEHVIRTSLVDVIPHVGLRWDRIKTDSYQLKTGGVAAMETSVKTMDVVSVPVGVALAHSHQDAATGWNSRIMADAYVMPRFGDTEATVTTRLMPYVSQDSAKTEVMSDLVFGGTVGVEIYKEQMSFGFRMGLEGSDQNTSATAGVQAVFRF